MTSSAPDVEKLEILGPAGILEVLKECPKIRSPRGVAVVCHPHPLHGGTMENKVVHTLARAFLAVDCASIRFNYRGVGKSEGGYDDGRGEADDAIAIARWATQQWPDSPLLMAGFSFGAIVAIGVESLLTPIALVAVAPPVKRLPPQLKQPQCPWLVVQGDEDTVVDTDDVVDWFNSLDPGPELRVMTGSEHFFHGRLTELRENVVEFLDRSLAESTASQET
ncbi:MAG: alpha/beta hydrolase [Gammaproteobacteria bacterium]